MTLEINTDPVSTTDSCCAPLRETVDRLSRQIEIQQATIDKLAAAIQSLSEAAACSASLLANTGKVYLASTPEEISDLRELITRMAALIEEKCLELDQVKKENSVLKTERNCLKEEAENLKNRFTFCEKQLLIEKEVNYLCQTVARNRSSCEQNTFRRFQNIRKDEQATILESRPMVYDWEVSLCRMSDSKRKVAIDAASDAILDSSCRSFGEVASRVVSCMQGQFGGRWRCTVVQRECNLWNKQAS